MPKGSHVLMADDDKMLVDMYKERLELAGYKITIARNGEEALAKIRETKPDIVMLDIMMPKVNGYETLASIKSDPQTKDIPVIMLSALMRDFNREKAVEAGADDYLIKSEAMPSDVITKIEQVLTKYGKGTTPIPGAVAPNIPTVTAAVPSTPPPVPVPPPITPPTPPIPPIPTPTPPLPPLPPKVESSHASDLPPVVDHKTNNIHSEPVIQPVSPAVTPPEKIIFEPAKVEKPISNDKPLLPITEPEKPGDTIETTPMGIKEPKVEEDEVPIVKIQPKTAASPVPPPMANPSLDKPINQQVSPLVASKKERSPASVALIVILVVLLTALINDLVIYYFFFLKK